MVDKVICGFDSRGEKQIGAIVAALKKLKLKPVVVDCAGLDYVDATLKCITAFEKDNSADAICLACGTGVGVSIVANRFSFIRAVNADSAEKAYFARRHEDANCLCLAAGYSDGTKTINAPQIQETIDTFFKTEFEGGRHKERVDKLQKMGE